MLRTPKSARFVQSNDFRIIPRGLLWLSDKVAWRRHPRSACLFWWVLREDLKRWPGFMYFPLCSPHSWSLWALFLLLRYWQSVWVSELMKDSVLILGSLGCFSTKKLRCFCCDGLTELRLIASLQYNWASIVQDFSNWLYSKGLSCVSSWFW